MSSVDISMNPPSEPHASSVVKQQWRCDVCNEMTFFSFEEACAHEGLCRKRLEERRRSTSETAATTTTTTTTQAGVTPTPDPSQKEHQKKANVSAPSRPGVECIVDLRTPKMPKLPKPMKRRTQQPATRSQTSSFTNADADTTYTILSNSSSQKTHGKESSKSDSTRTSISLTVANATAATAPTTTSRQTTTKKSVHPFFAAKPKKRDQPSDATNTKTTKGSKTHRCNSQKKAKTQRPTTASGGGGGGSAKETTQSTLLSLGSRPKRKTTQVVLSYAESSANRENEVEAKRHNNTSGKQRRTKSSSKQTKLAPLFVVNDDEDKDNKQQTPSFSSQELLAQQRASQFLVQRRLKEQQERAKRERQRLRREREALQEGSAVSAGTILGTCKTRCTGVVARRDSLQAAHVAQQRLPLAPRFPHPCHVVPAVRTTTTTTACPLTKATTDAETNDTDPWTPRERRVTRLEPSTTEDVTYAPLFAAKADTMTGGGIGGDGSVVHHSDHDDILWQRTLSTLVTSRPPSSSSKPSCERTTLWVDRYLGGGTGTMSLGARMVAADVRLTDFIEGFMVQRQKAEVRMAERQRRRQQTSTKPKKRRPTSYYNDDDLWDDDDDEDGDATTSLCLITGPVGCGKSTLVHSVAARVGCRKVVELHTAMKRGSAAMKRCIEEATKSHSTLDMLQNEKEKTAAFSVFQKKRQELVDSDDDDDTNGKGVDEKGSSVTVILIDEVDNLYEEHGDNGFWTALSELYKRSKCPIILTANTYPIALDSSAFRFTHIFADRPTPSECAESMIDICRKEQILFRQEETKLAKQLGSIAQIMECDMRRLVHGLQVFATGSVVPIFNESSILSSAEADIRSSPTLANDSVRVLSIQPHAILANTYTLLTITGSNFERLAVPSPDRAYSCNVSLGGQLCSHAQIVDDCTILAVCGPRNLPANLDSTGVYRESHKRSVSTWHLSLSVCGNRPLGVTSVSSSIVAGKEQADESRVLGTLPSVSLECNFPGFSYEHVSKIGLTYAEGASGSDSEVELEFPSSALTKPTKMHSSAAVGDQPSMTEADSKYASQLLKEGLDAWCSVHGPIQELGMAVQSEDSSAITSISAVEALSLKCSSASDAALLADIGLSGVPYLGGACRGFGYDMTDEFPKRTNSTSKPPSEDQLFAKNWNADSYFYGDSDAFMTAPTLCRGFRNHLRRIERSSRGLAQVQANEMESPVEEGELEFVPTEEADENAFLSRLAPPPMQALPDLLYQDFRSLSLNTKLRFVDLRREENANSAKDFLSDYIFTSSRRMLFRSMPRAVDPLTHNNRIDTMMLAPALPLDYLPILRGMAVQERVAQAVFLAAQALDPDTAMANTAGMRHRRSTRGSKKKGRKHYFEERVVPGEIWRTGDHTAMELGDQLAEQSLLYV